MKKNQQPITGCGDGDIAKQVFLCGDPGRVPVISADWAGVEEVCRIREFVIHTGTQDGVPLTAASTGVGGPSTAVLFEELVKLGGATFIRVGNSGALAARVGLGDAVISTGAVRDDGTSKSYVLPEYPAVAHYQVVGALEQAARTLGVVTHVGVTWSVDAFYARNKVLGPDGGLRSMSVNGYEQSGMNERMRDMQKAGILNIEMEASTILTLAGLFGVRAGCICTVSDRAPWPGPGEQMIDLDRNIRAAIRVATAAMLDLAGQDQRGSR